MGFIRQKLIQLVLVLTVVTFFTTLMLKQLPGDPCIAFLGASASPEKLEQCQEENGVKDSAIVNWGRWVKGAVQGDLGESFANRIPVTTALEQKWPVTFSLILYSTVIALLVAVPLAVFSAYKAGGKFDSVVSTISYGFISMPTFVLGLILVYFFSVKWQLFPAVSYTHLTDNVVEHFKSVTLPVAALSLTQIPTYLRLLRGDLIATLQEDFITMAKSKGVSDRRILWRHALRPSSFTLITILGINIGQLIGGTLILEFLFGLNGIGSYIVQSIAARDYGVVQSLTALVSVVFVLANFGVDLMYALLDPRIRRVKAAS